VTSEEATAVVIEALGFLGIPYMLVGSLSSNYYGVPRSTQDADFVVQLHDITITTLVGRLGRQFQLDPQLSFETIQATTRYVLKLVNNPFHIELFLLSDDAYDLERFNRRRQVRIFDRDVYIPTVEDVIITKLRWSQHGRRIKDWDDVRNVLAVQGEILDWNYIRQWCAHHGTIKLLDEIRDSIPKG
jgi:hypothetical protein